MLHQACEIYWIAVNWTAVNWTEEPVGQFIRGLGPIIGGGKFSGKGGGTPIQGRIEEIFRVATIYRCGNTIHAPIF